MIKTELKILKFHDVLNNCVLIFVELRGKKVYLLPNNPELTKIEHILRAMDDTGNCKIKILNYL